MMRLRFHFTKFLRQLEYPLLFLSLLLLPTQLGKHFWPSFAYIYSIKTDYFAPVIYFWDLLSLLLIITFLLSGGKLNKNCLSILLVFLLTQVLSFFFSPNIGASFVRFEQYIVTGLWGVYIASQKLAQIKVVLWRGLGAAVLWSSLLAIIQFGNGKTVGLWFLGERSFDLTTISIATFNWYGQVFLRPYATFPHPNVLAAFLVLAIILFEWLISEKLRNGEKLFYLLVMIIGSAALFLTFSRVGVGLYAAVLLYLLRNKLKALLLLFLLLLPFLFVRFQSAFNFDQLSIIRREELAVQAIGLWVGSPFFGVGLNNFIYKLAAGDVVSGEVRFLQPVHNIFLLSLVETGVVGLLGVLVLIWTGISRQIRLIGHMGQIRRVPPLLVYVWICIFGFGMFDHFFLSLAQGQRLLFLVWGLSMINLRSGNN